MTTQIIKPQFKKFQRFDKAKAAKGVKHHIVDELGNDYGTWTTSLMDAHNKFLKVENERYERQHGDDDAARGKYAGVYAFVQVCVHDWSGVLDAKDKGIPFSKELAFEYLCDEENSWFTDELIGRSQDVRNYRVSPQANKEADVKN